METSREKRNRQYREAIEIVNREDISLSSALCYVKNGYYKHTRPWVDESSPTGMSQICDYDGYGTCQYPCNGDC